MDTLPPAEIVRQYTSENLHGATPGSSLEWWYLTGHFWENGTCDPKTGFASESSSGNNMGGLTTGPKPADLGIQFTTFYLGQGEQQGSLFHSAWSDPKAQKHEHFSQAESYRPGKLKGLLSQISPRWLDVFMGNTRLMQLGSRKDSLWSLNMLTKSREFNLVLKPQGLWLHGKDGFVEKVEGTGNVYVSFPFVPASGVMTDLATGNKKSICGSFWFDHETGVKKVQEVQWTWWAVRTPKGKSYMIYDIKSQSGARSLSGEVYDLHKETSSKLSKIEVSKNQEVCLRSKNCYPQSFTLSFLEGNRPESIEIKSLFPEQEILAPQGQGKTYWEGMASARMSNGENAFAYVEMTK